MVASFQTEPLNRCGNWLVRSGTAKCNAIAPRHRRAADNATVHFQGLVFLPPEIEWFANQRGSPSRADYHPRFNREWPSQGTVNTC